MSARKQFSFPLSHASVLTCTESLDQSPNVTDTNYIKKQKLFDSTFDSVETVGGGSSTTTRVCIWLPSDWTLPLRLSQSTYNFDIYRKVGYTLIQTLCKRRSQSKQDKRFHEECLEVSVEQTEIDHHRALIVCCSGEIESLDDGLIDLYVSQTMDWTLAARSVSFTVSHKTVYYHVLAIALAALSIVLKTYHSDNGIDLCLSLSEMSLIGESDRSTLCAIEMALLRSVDYNVFKFRDSYTTLLRYPETLVANVNDKQFAKMVSQREFLPRFGTNLRKMIVDRIDAFAVYSPWARANAAMALTINQWPRVERITNRSPSRKEAMMLRNLIKKVQKRL